MTLYKNIDDEELVRQLKFDDKNAFTEIYNRYWKLLFSTAQRITDNTDSAQDTVQNIFLSLWQRRHEVDIISLKAYLQQATRYAVLQAIREKQSDDRFYERLRILTSEIINDDPVIFKEQQELLKELLESMPENCTRTYLLSREEGLTYKQIAARLEISEKTVEKRMTKSLKYLRRGLNWNYVLLLLYLLSTGCNTAIFQS